MKWTKELPTVSGYYWHRKDAEDKLPKIIVVNIVSFFLLLGRYGEWFGPISLSEIDESVRVSEIDKDGGFIFIGVASEDNLKELLQELRHRQEKENISIGWA